MQYQRFEDLPVWNDAINLAVDVYSLTSSPQFRSPWSLKNQLERAALSISNNVPERFERGTNKELLNFLYIARGSAGEVRSMLCLLERVPAFQTFTNEIEALKSRSKTCSRQLKGWAKSLQDSSFKGERYVTEKMKRAAQATRERDEFLRELRNTMNPKLVSE